MKHHGSSYYAGDHTNYRIIIQIRDTNDFAT